MTCTVYLPLSTIDYVTISTIRAPYKRAEGQLLVIVILALLESTSNFHRFFGTETKIKKEENN